MHPRRVPGTAVLPALLTGRFQSGPSSSGCCPTHPRVSGSLLNFLGFPARGRSLAPSRTWQAGVGCCVPSFLPEGHDCSAWGGFSLFYISYLSGWAELCVQSLPRPPAPSTAPVSRLAAGSLPTGGCWPLPSRSSRAVGWQLRSQFPHWPGFPLSSPKFTWLDTKQRFGSPSWGSPTAASSGCLLPLCWGVTLWGTWQDQAAPKGDSAGAEQV